MFNKITINEEESPKSPVQELKQKIEEDFEYITVNEFTEESAKNFIEQFSKIHSSDQTIIPIIIDSYGGYLDSLTAMVDIIKTSDKPVATICIGKAMSCGAILLTCGTQGYRYISPTSSVMIHHVSSWSWGKVAEMEVEINETKRRQQQIFDIMDQNCGQKKGFFLKKIDNNLDWYLSPEECLEYNIVNHIKIPKLETNIKIDVKLV